MSGQQQIKIRKIDQDEQLRPPLCQSATQEFLCRDNIGEMGDNFEKADDGDLRRRKDNLDTRRRQFHAADPAHPKIGPLGPHRGNQSAAMEIAGRLAGHDHDLGAHAPAAVLMRLNNSRLWCSLIWSMTCRTTSSALRPSIPLTIGVVRLRT